MPARIPLDEAPFGTFHKRLTIYSCGGPFCDGYILGIIAVALPPLTRELGLTPGMQGLIAAAALFGMFLGGAVFGFLTDLVGRRVMYTLDLAVFLCASVAQFWVHHAGALLLLRLALGVAIGADYPIASALMAEFAPRRHRGRLLAAMIGAWWLGYTLSFLVGYALSFDRDLGWRWMLSSSALPAAAAMLLRWGTPESPRWLMSQGRVHEARQVVELHLGGDYELPVSAAGNIDYRHLFSSPYRARFVFVCLFWSCQIVPTFGIDTYAPALLETLGSPAPVLGSAVMGLFFLGGVTAAICLVERIGRRLLLTIPFAITSVALGALGLVDRPTSPLAILCLVTFAMFNAASSVLQWIYPNELFPTEIRATAVGLATAVSRVGAAVGTFLVPLALHRFGVSYLMVVFAGISALGYMVALRCAPETSALSLSEASANPGERRFK